MGADNQFDLATPFQQDSQPAKVGMFNNKMGDIVLTDKTL
jgi:hypothetical protein